MKGIFPYSFVNKDNLNYIGDVPVLDYFDNVSLEDYNNYYKDFNSNWNLKNEAIKYCELDCISLFQVIETFGKLIFELFQINITNVSTLPSLAFKIFRVHYLPKSVKIPVLAGKIYDDICQAYFGGHVDMYIPSNNKSEKVYHYDVNSLYPYSMVKYNYPTNIIAYFTGNILNMSEFLNLY